ncbi:trypsin-like serine protease [Hyalangium rubrum]|uniref:trypsin-like serine protease n=1 Tax=Hyalangium rubrum TaxID=3103134 RepID=UPI003BF590E4
MGLKWLALGLLCPASGRVGERAQLTALTVPAGHVCLLELFTRGTVSRSSSAFIGFSCAFAWLFPVAIPEASAQAGVVEEPLLSGTATTARPEVGQFLTGGGACTGTLIASRWVVTASHCTQHLSLFFPGGTSPATFGAPAGRRCRRRT